MSDVRNPLCSYAASYYRLIKHIDCARRQRGVQLRAMTALRTIDGCARASNYPIGGGVGGCKAPRSESEAGASEVPTATGKRAGAASMSMFAANADVR